MSLSLTGHSSQENLENRGNKGKQMTAIQLTGAPLASKLEWDSIKWKHVQNEVSRLQMRIAKAFREKRYGKAKALQRLLTSSLSFQTNDFIVPLEDTYRYSMKYLCSKEKT